MYCIVQPVKMTTIISKNDANHTLGIGGLNCIFVFRPFVFQYAHMNSILRISFFLFYVSVFISCSKEDKKEETGTLHINWLNKVGNDTIRPDVLTYTNTSGNTYSVSLLKYYVTNFTFTGPNGMQHNAKNYDLIDAWNPSSWKINLDNIPNGVYDTLRFLVGIDSSKNFDLVQTGDLDPSYNMFWSWNTGYIFFKHEGQFIGTNGDTLPVRLHYGGMRAMAEVALPLHLTVDGDSRTADITFDLNGLYSNPDIDFNIDNDHQSMFANERTWMENMRTNFSHSFVITGIR
jgi:hypothetical protein